MDLSVQQIMNSSLLTEWPMRWGRSSIFLCARAYLYTAVQKYTHFWLTWLRNLNSFYMAEETTL